MRKFWIGVAFILAGLCLAATALAQLLNVWKSTRSVDTAKSPGRVEEILQGMEIQSEGARVEMRGSGPVEALQGMIR